MCAHALKHAAASDSAGVVFWNDHLLAIFSVSTDATPKSNSCVFTWRIPRHCHACCWPLCEIRWKWSKWKNNAGRKHYAPPPLIFFFIGQFGHAVQTESGILSGNRSRMRIRVLYSGAKQLHEIQNEHI